jgi:hypothetical protein
MSLAAVLKVDGKEFKILSCNFGFSQDADNRGMVASRVRAGMINLTIPHVNDTILINWMLGFDTRKNGEIIFSGYSDRVTRQTLIFEDAVLIGYHESFSEPLDSTISLTISCRKITVLNVDFENTWVT